MYDATSAGAPCTPTPSNFKPPAPKNRADPGHKCNATLTAVCPKLWHKGNKCHKCAAAHKEELAVHGCTVIPSNQSDPLDHTGYYCLPPPANHTPALELYSEDCLFLNIWRPKPEPEPAAEPAAVLLPVMLYVHGGGMMGGSGSGFNGSRLASHGLLVVSHGPTADATSLLALSLSSFMFLFPPTHQPTKVRAGAGEWQHTRLSALAR